MTFLRRAVKASTTIESFTNLSAPPKLYTTLRSTGRDRSMQLTTVWACIRLRAETLGMLPVSVVEYSGPNRVPQELPTWLERPNPETTRFELFERTSASLDSDGNAFWWIARDRMKRVAEVWPIPPTSVEVYREKPAKLGDPPGPKRFRVGHEEFGTDEVLQISGFSLPGRLRGLSPIEQHAHSLGLAIAAEEHGEAFMRNGMTMSGVLVAEKDPGKVNAERMQAQFESKHRGYRNAGRPGFLFGGTTWQQLSIPNDQAQYLETRKFQAVEITQIFRVPAHKVNILDHATFSNIEHQAIEWVQDGVLPYTTRIESAIHAAGLLDMGQHLRFNLGGLLRGDTMSRYAAYAIGRQWGWLCVDDILALEDRNPLPDGKGQVYLEPMNMIPAASSQPPEVANAMRDSGISPAVIESVTGVRVGPKEDQ